MASDSKIGLVLGGLAVLVLVGGGVTALLTTGGGEEVEEAETEAPDAAAAVDEADAPEDAVADAKEAGKDTGLAAVLAGAEAAEAGSADGEAAPADGEAAPADAPDGADLTTVEGEATEDEPTDQELIDILAGTEETFAQAIGEGPDKDTGDGGDDDDAEEKKPGKKGQCRVDARVEKKGDTFHIPRSVLDSYAKNPAKAGELGSFWWATGKQKKKPGVRLGKLPCPGLMRAAGFRPGDVVVAVNGARPVSVASAVSIYGAARKKGSAVVLVRRGKKGQKKTVKLNYRFTDG